MTNSKQTAPFTDAGLPGAPRLIDYRYTHARTVGSTGYFSCEPAEEPALETALAAFMASPLDDFLHEHLLHRLCELDEASLLSLAERALNDANPNPVLTALFRESALVFPKVQSALGQMLQKLPAKASAEWTAPELRLASAARPDHKAALKWSQLFQANLASHRPLPRLEESGIPLLHSQKSLGEAMRQVSRPDSADILSSLHARLAAQDWRPGGRPPAQETFARAMSALEKNGLLAGPEMRHEASLSPIALLRNWHLHTQVQNGRHFHELRGTATSYGRGLSLAGARAACAMEIVERSSAYASLVHGGTYGNGEIAGRSKPLPLHRATANELAKAGKRTLLPFMPNERQAQAPLHWLSAQSAKGVEALVPLQNVLLFCNADEPRLAAIPGSTGLASGNSIEEARLSALLEVIERDADATTPFCRHSCFRLASREARIQGLLDDYAARGIRVQFQDIASEFGLPAYRSFVTALDGSVATATGASLRGADAILSALTETPWPYSYATPAPHGVASGPGLSGLPVRWLEDLPDWSLSTPQASLALLEAVLAAHGHEIFYVELTRADLNIPVVRALAPGLEAHADFDSLLWPSARLFARQALLNEGADASHHLFRA